MTLLNGTTTYPEPVEVINRTRVLLDRLDRTSPDCTWIKKLEELIQEVEGHETRETSTLTCRKLHTVLRALGHATETRIAISRQLTDRLEKTYVALTSPRNAPLNTEGVVKLKTTVTRLEEGYASLVCLNDEIESRINILDNKNRGLYRFRAVIYVPSTYDKYRRIVAKRFDVHCMYPAKLKRKITRKTRSTIRRKYG